MNSITMPLIICEQQLAQDFLQMTYGEI